MCITILLDVTILLDKCIYGGFIPCGFLSIW